MPGTVPHTSFPARSSLRDRKKESKFWASLAFRRIGELTLVDYIGDSSSIRLVYSLAIALRFLVKKAGLLFLPKVITICHGMGMEGEAGDSTLCFKSLFFTVVLPSYDAFTDFLTLKKNLILWTVNIYIFYWIQNLYILLESIHSS